MDMFEYALRAYNLVLELVVLIIGAALGPWRYLTALVMGALIGLAIVGLVAVYRHRRGAKRT